MGSERFEVRATQDWQVVDERLGGVEDSVVRRFHFEGPDQILDDRSLLYGGLSAAVCEVEVQTQFDDFELATLRFEGVRDLRYDPRRDVTPMTWSEVGDVWQVEFLSLAITAEICLIKVET